ncbi:hypothetical protein ILFOPFJJ_06752 [Ensifer psoraleae]|nr:hypothetical protein [Sinorhizobium psoraleae]
MSGNEDGDHLVADILPAQRLSRFLVLCREHYIQEVAALSKPWITQPLLDQRIGDVSQSLRVGMETAIAQQHQLGRALREARTVARLVERAGHGRNEGVHLFLVEAVEAAAEGTERNRVKRQPRHVVGDINLCARTESLPAHHHLLSDVEHRVEHISQPERPERGRQQAMRFSPVRFFVISREQAVFRHRPQLPERRMQGFAEPAFVAQLGCEFLAADDDDLPPEGLKSVDGSEVSCQPHQALDGSIGIDGRHMTKDGKSLWLGYWLNLRHMFDSSKRPQ